MNLNLIPMNHNYIIGLLDYAIKIVERIPLFT